MKPLVLLLAAAMLFGCKAYQPINLSDIRVGMEKDAALRTLNRRSDNVIGSRKYGKDVVEVVQVSGYYPSGGLAEQYWLYFLNDELVQWGRPGDWQREADHVYELRVR